MKMGARIIAMILQACRQGTGKEKLTGSSLSRQQYPMREAELLAHIQTRSADLTGLCGPFGEILVGPGDDCAVIRQPDGGLMVIGVDQLVAGRHFEPETDIDLIARKSIARAVSDIAAMGARPAWALATGLLPSGYADADALFDAMARWAKHFGCPLIGGDIATGPKTMPLSLTVTAAGRMGDGTSPLLRSGAKVGDELWLTGPIGGSFETGWHLRFEPRVAAGLAAAAEPRVHAAIDLSDGLGRDAARIGAASGVRVEIEAARLPINHRCTDWREAVSAGEDYELLLTIAPVPETTSADAPTLPPLTLDPPLLGPVGRVRVCQPGEEPGATIIDAYGAGHDAGELGWDHA
jgi:thiamine-monophosphate kinase